MTEAPVGAARRRPLPDWCGPATRLVHSDRRAELNAGAVVFPIYETTTFRYPAAYSEAVGDAYLYSRNRNPTVEGPAQLLRELEGGEEARLFSSGMAALSAVVLSLVGRGEEVVAAAELYGGTLELFQRHLPRFGIGLTLLAEPAARDPAAAVNPRTRLVLLETPTNPTLRVHDIARWAEAAHRVGATCVVDGTFATPINQHPLALGADVVVHSATKYLGGHADVTAGAVVGSRAILDRLDPHQVLGGSLDPFPAFLLERSLKTLALRVARQNETARAVVEATARHPSVARVHYPGRAGSEEETIAARQMRGRGGMVSLSLHGGAAAAEAFLSRLRIVEVASSLGGVESLASRPSATSHRHLSADERARRGIDDGLVRLSLGIEEAADLVRDITEALDATPVSGTANA